MLITLFTDAGYCYNTKLASWAAWAKCDGKTMRYSGVFKTEVTGSEVAEIQAIINGLFAAKKFFNPEQHTRILVQTDCQTAINVLQRPVLRRSKKKVEFDALKKVFIDLTKGFNIEFRWVESHKGTVTPRNAVNSWCDGECTRLLKKAREEKAGKRTRKEQLEFDLKTTHMLRSGTR